LLATVLYERNDLEGAAESARLSVELSDLGEEVDHKIGAYFCWANKLLAEGDAGGARNIIEKLDQVALHPSAPKAAYAAYHISLALQQNDLAAAVEWGKRLSVIGESALGIWNQYIPVRLLIARGENLIAAQRLRELYAKAIQAGAQGYGIRVRVYQALTADTSDEALAFLSDALKLGEPEGFIRTFVDEGRLLKPLLRRALADGITPEYTAKLLGIIDSEEQLRQAKNAKREQVAASLEFLSNRELEILRLVVAGLSNGQIADRLIISPGTVKRHVHNIFEKLNARDRLHAVNRARELKLI
jgi:LuxR family transcriptional regulator, maltose regulon positive regulatory protein